MSVRIGSEQSNTGDFLYISNAQSSFHKSLFRSVVHHKNILRNNAPHIKIYFSRSTRTLPTFLQPDLLRTFSLLQLLFPLSSWSPSEQDNSAFVWIKLATCLVLNEKLSDSNQGPFFRKCFFLDRCSSAWLNSLHVYIDHVSFRLLLCVVGSRRRIDSGRRGHWRPLLWI